MLQLFFSDPAGMFVRYKCKAIGSGSEGAQITLQEGYSDSLTLAEAETLAVSTLKQVRRAPFFLLFALFFLLSSGSRSKRSRRRNPTTLRDVLADEDLLGTKGGIGTVSFTGVIFNIGIFLMAQVVCSKHSYLPLRLLIVPCYSIFLPITR